MAEVWTVVMGAVLATRWANRHRCVKFTKFKLSPHSH